MFFILQFEGNAVPYTARNSFRILIGLWLLSMVVITYAYTGVLTSMLASPKLEPTVDSLDELVKGEKFRLTLEKKTFFSIQALV